MTWFKCPIGGGSGPTEYELIPTNQNIHYDTYIRGDGVEVGYGGWSSTDYIDIGDATKLYRYGYIESAEWNAFYNANKGFISVPGPSGITNVPSNAKYVRFSAETSSITSSSNRLVAYYGT